MTAGSSVINKTYTNRVRVRTPGKYVVLFLFLPVCIVAVGAGIWLNYQKEQSLLAALEYRKSANGRGEAYLSLPEILVDLAPDQNGRKAYLKLNASLLLDSHEARRLAFRLEEKKPFIKERLTFYLRILRPEDFDGSDSQERLKRELVRRVNIAIAPDTIDDLIIEDLIIQ